jgi:hypothetical protein
MHRRDRTLIGSNEITDKRTTETRDPLIESAYSPALPVNLPDIEHSRSLPRREARIASISRVVHEVVDRIRARIALRAIRSRHTYQ